MIDKKKVIQALDDSLKNQHCGFVDGVGDVYAVSEETIRNAIVLLKEQEPLAVYEGKVNKCVCGNGINRYWHPEYCGFCGKKLVWY